MLEVVLSVVAPINILVLRELPKSLTICFLLHSAADDLLRRNLGKDGFPFLDFEVGHSEGVSGAGE